ncbi:putative RNA recognition motif domain, nucleotide-binding alpha-beta plait domain superfamily [Helianthus annuus]|nr:putative RNA recognition motif domain, nucleotide-binding alpha-beta plait domain superfamily [Helianthus annuus]
MGEPSSRWPENVYQQARQGNGAFNNQGDTTKFFVTNLPETCNSFDLANTFRNYGNVTGTYVARKRDKVGNVFGFVSMKGVKDREDMVKSLNTIRMGNWKIKVNIARFTKENPGKMKGPVQPNPTMKPHQVFQTHQPVNLDARFQPGNGKSYADTVRSDKIMEIELGVDQFNLWHGRALIGTTNSINILRTFHILLKRAGINNTTFQYLGGCNLMLVFESREEANVFMGNKTQWGEWFCRLVRWEGQSFPYERIAWLKILGVPLQLMQNKLFNDIGAQYGKILHPSQFEGNDINLSFEYVGILVDKGERISDAITLKWRGKAFKIWIEEEIEEWIPDCLKGDLEEQKVCSKGFSPVTSGEVLGDFQNSGDNKNSDGSLAGSENEGSEQSEEEGSEDEEDDVLVEDTPMMGSKKTAPVINLHGDVNVGNAFKHP